MLHDFDIPGYSQIPDPQTHLFDGVRVLNPGQSFGRGDLPSGPLSKIAFRFSGRNKLVACKILRKNIAVPSTDFIFTLEYQCSPPECAQRKGKIEIIFTIFAPKY